MERGFFVEEKRIKGGLKGKRKLLLIPAVVLVAAIVLVIGMRSMSGEEAVGFEVVDENRIPMEITNDVIPEYKTLERALACRSDDDIYVMVTRGEKPTSGFGVSVDKMSLEEKDGKTNLIVYALFEDPDKETPISQIITYPMSIVKTDLTALPDTIELRIQY